jgi:two-component system NarL family sensor kinase
MVTLIGSDRYGFTVILCKRVFNNLLINAINHSRRGDHIEVVLETQTSYQIVKILDTGAGMQLE